MGYVVLAIFYLMVSVVTWDMSRMFGRRPRQLDRPRPLESGARYAASRAGVPIWSAKHRTCPPLKLMQSRQT